MKRKTKEEYLASLIPDKLLLSNLADTIGQAYIDGIDEADEKYRKAIVAALNKYNIPIAPFICTVFNNINK